MFTEQYVASTLRPSELPSTAHLSAKERDAGIYTYDFQPHPSQKLTFKKSSTHPNGLAISRTHVFAAQADKAAVHVYDRATGKQECLVPFPEKPTSLALLRNAGEVVGEGSNTVLSIGMESGRIGFWELGTGRQVFSASGHLQAITCLAANPAYTHLLSGGPDASVQVWSVPSLLSFADSADSTLEPIHSLTRHRRPITAIAIGHSHSSAGFAVTASEDNSCLVWAYHTGTLLHNVLLASAPLCLAIDPADRAFFTGHSDGAVQLVDFYAKACLEHPILDGENARGVMEPRQSDRWTPEASETTAVRSITLTYDGTKVLTGHESGSIHAWDVGTGKVVQEKVASVIGAVTNLCALPVHGLARSPQELTSLINVVKPSQIGLTQADEGHRGDVPEKYTFQARFQRPITAISPEDTYKGTMLEDSRMADFVTDVFEVGWTSRTLEDDAAALQTSEGTGNQSALAALSSQSETETEELHVLLAHKTEESIELRARVEALGGELVRLRQAERDRKRLHKIKRARRAEAEEQRLRRNTNAAAPDVSDSILADFADLGSESDDLSVEL